MRDGKYREMLSSLRPFFYKLVRNIAEEIDLISLWQLRVIIMM